MAHLCWLVAVHQSGLLLTSRALAKSLAWKVSRTRRARSSGEKATDHSCTTQREAHCQHHVRVHGARRERWGSRTEVLGDLDKVGAGVARGLEGHTVDVAEGGQLRHPHPRTALQDLKR